MLELPVLGGGSYRVAPSKIVAIGLNYRAHVAESPSILAARATVPGLRRLELELDAAADVPTVVVGVLGPARRRWPRELTASLGPRTRHLDGAAHGSAVRR